jgi:hypothetical protein
MCDSGTCPQPPFPLSGTQCITQPCLDDPGFSTDLTRLIKLIAHTNFLPSSNRRLRLFSIPRLNRPDLWRSGFHLNRSPHARDEELQGL